MITLEGVPSALIARNESWVREQANSLARRLPSNVERADLIQVGLIAVAQASLGFEWEGDAQSDEGKEAFIRYARLRVKGAMLDELRQMDHLGRGERRKVKVIQIARERWLAKHGEAPSLAELSEVCSMSVDEISKLEQMALQAQTESLTHDDDDDISHASREPGTSADEVEARVDTAIVLCRLEKFFATLPARDRQLIDTYLGVGLTPSDLAKTLNVTPSRVSQLCRAAYERIAQHFGNPVHREAERRCHGAAAQPGRHVDIEARERQLAQESGAPGWGVLIEKALEGTDAGHESGRIEVTPHTRWG